MKKVVLGLSFALVGLVLFLSPVLAEPHPSQAMPALSAADQAFLSSLATQAGTPEPVAAAKRPGRIGEKALCSATASCGDGTTVYCESNNSVSSCSAADRSCPERGHVTCDGVTTVCPTPCICDLNCTEERSLCESDCYPCAFNFTCSMSTCTVSCHCRFSTCF